MGINYNISDEYREEQYQKYKISCENDPRYHEALSKWMNRIYRQIEEDIFRMYEV